MVVLKYFDAGWSTLHELGHTFNLYHTFEASYGVENVTRNSTDQNCYNADRAGDLVTDTDAALELGFLETSVTRKIDAECNNDNCTCTYDYSNDERDQCGVELIWNNDIWKNLMNYGSRLCSRTFTPGQIDRMWDGFLQKVNLGQFDFCLLPSPDDCPSFLNLSGATSSGQYVVTSSSIESSQIIQPSNQLHTFSSQTTILRQGFHAKTGSNILVKRGSCGCN